MNALHILAVLALLPPGADSKRVAVIGGGIGGASFSLYYSKLPPEMASCNVLLCDPMLATGGSALMAIEVLKEAGVPDDKILFLNVLSCPEGLQKLAEHAPAVRILTAALDDGLNACVLDSLDFSL